MSKRPAQTKPAAPCFWFKPLGDFVLLKRYEPEEKVGSIYIPPQAQAKRQQSVVMACGEDATKVKPGEHVIVGKYAGIDYELESEVYLLVKQKDIAGIVLNE